MAVVATPQWLKDLRERRKLARDEEKKPQTLSWISTASKPTSPAMVYFVGKRSVSNGSQSATHTESHEISNGCGRVPEPYEELEVFTDTANGFSPSGFSPKYNSDRFSPSTARTEINLEYVSQSPSVHKLSHTVTSDDENEESYQPGFVNKLKDKWAKRLGPDSPRHVSVSGQSYDDHDDHYCLSGRKGSLSGLGSNQLINGSFDSPMVKASSMENLIDPSDSYSNSTFVKKLYNERKLSFEGKSGSAEDLSLQLPNISKSKSRSTPALNGHEDKPLTSSLSPSEPKRLNSDDEMPRPNTVLAALSMFEKKPVKSKRQFKFPVSTRKPIGNANVISFSKPAKKKKVPTATLR